MMFRSALLALSLVSTPALAQYHAQPQARPSEARVIASEMLWRCGDGGCVAPSNHSRPAIVCARLAREVGALSSFTVQGRAFTEQELQACNSRAR
jgi:hypothetical protein